MTPPTCSVITSTWQRHEALLQRAIPSVLAQTYPDVRHVIASDGPDDYLADLLPQHASQRYVQLPGMTRRSTGEPRRAGPRSSWPPAIT